jgi:hypothetical protein
MLPDIRAVIAAMVAAVGLLMISFALVSTYRVAQQHQAGSLQADLAKRGRAAFTAQPGERQIPIIETPGPHLAAPVARSGVPPQTEPVAATPVPEPEPAAPVAAALPPPVETAPAGPPIGGSLAPAPETSRAVAAENPAQVDTRALQQAERARKARAARVARERKAAARRAAQARRAKQRETPAFGTNSFGGSFGGTFTAPTGR